MGYVDGSNINPEVAKREMNLLRQGFNYADIAEITGSRRYTISERNRLVYKINIWDAFRERLNRDGIPNRLTVSDDFGNWFSGFFDGEGTITAFSRPCSNTKYREYRLSVRIMLRDDDAGVITRIHDNLQIGHISRNGGKGRINPTIAWCAERINDVAEVIIPLFDKYPLYSKKAKEYAIWKPLVMQRYINTLGGYSNRSGIPEEDRTTFLEAIEMIKEIRAY